MLAVLARGCWGCVMTAVPGQGWMIRFWLSPANPFAFNDTPVVCWQCGADGVWRAQFCNPTSGLILASSPFVPFYLWHPNSTLPPLTNGAELLAKSAAFRHPRGDHRLCESACELVDEMRAQFDEIVAEDLRWTSLLPPPPPPTSPTSR